MNIADKSIIFWLLKNEMKTEKGVPVDFKRHLFQYDIFRDLSPNQVCLKGAQIGFTILEIFKSFFVAKNLGLDIIFTQPTDKDVQIFAGGKVNRIINNNPVLREYTKDKDSVEQKVVGNSMIYYRGTFTRKSAISVTADLLIHDEVDFSDQEVISDYESRLQHSQYGWKWYFGHPSVSNTGVAKIWGRSDQKHWFITCPKCKVEHYMEFPDSVCFDRKVYQCKYCKAELKDIDRIKGRWVNKYNMGDIVETEEGKVKIEYSGYWIPLLIAPWISAEKILDYYKNKPADYFYNRVLGLPYDGSGNKVSKQIILQNLTSKINSQQGRIVIGVDTGIDIRYVMGNNEGLFFYGESNDYKPIEKALKDYPNAIAVIDQGGDIVAVRKLREKYPGRVFLCHYSQDRKTLQLIRWGDKDEDGNVIVDRNRMIQFVIDEFKDKRVPLQGTEADWYDYWLHWSHIYRIQEEDNLQVLRNKWLRNGRDDWVHATLYWRVGMSRFAQGEGFIFNGLDDTLPKPIDENPITKKNA